VPKILRRYESPNHHWELLHLILEPFCSFSGSRRCGPHAGAGGQDVAGTADAADAAPGSAVLTLRGADPDVVSTLPPTRFTRRCRVHYTHAPGLLPCEPLLISLCPEGSRSTVYGLRYTPRRQRDERSAACAQQVPAFKDAWIGARAIVAAACGVVTHRLCGHSDNSGRERVASKHHIAVARGPHSPGYRSALNGRRARESAG
jgi:hypothetical protein